MVKELSFKFGRAQGLGPEVVKITPVTVFVGPNNSGKSKILEELNSYCQNGQCYLSNVILDRVKLGNFTEVEAREIIAKLTIAPKKGEVLPPQQVIVGKRATKHRVQLEALVTALQDADGNSSSFCEFYLGYNTLILDGRNRIGLVSQQAGGDLQEEARTSLQVLFKDNTRRAEVRRIIYEAFGLHFVVDPTNLGQLRIRLADRAPLNEVEERGLHSDAVNYHRNAVPIEATSDGVKAFTGIITEIVAGDPVVLLIDEPEAFLHPALAFKLGKEIGQASLSSGKRLFVSTHSPYFVKGCIQSGVPINIVRLTHRNGIGRRERKSSVGLGRKVEGGSTRIKGRDRGGNATRKEARGGWTKGAIRHGELRMVAHADEPRGAAKD